MLSSTNHEMPLVCNLGAFTSEEQERYDIIREEMQRATEEVQELSDGYAFRYPGTPDMIQLLAEFISLERRCCPFFHFTLISEPGDGPTWLQLTGGEGAKEFLQMEMVSN